MWHWVLYALVGISVSAVVYCYALKTENSDKPLTSDDVAVGTVIFGLIWPITLLLIFAAMVRSKLST